MTIIRTTCTRCGGIFLTPDDLELELRPGGREGDYRFKCPKCSEPQRRSASARVVSVLMATGVTAVVVDLDPISEWEIAAFVAALETDSDPFRLPAG